MCILAQTQGRNIRHYAAYLAERVRAYKNTKLDWVRAKETRLETLSVEKGLLRETEIVQRQLTALLKCDVCWDLRFFGGAMGRANLYEKRYWTNRKTRLP